jgi:hypothetical protein
VVHVSWVACTRHAKSAGSRILYLLSIKPSRRASVASMGRADPVLVHGSFLGV